MEPKQSVAQIGKSAERREITPTQYSIIHQWVTSNYGKANRCIKCENPNRKRYEWALVKGKKYEKNIENFIPLCASCHRIYDNIVINTPRDEHFKRMVSERLSKAIVCFDKYGSFVKEYPSVVAAGKAMGGSKTGITQVLDKDNRTAFGLKWKTKDKSIKYTTMTRYELLTSDEYISVTIASIINTKYLVSEMRDSVTKAMIEMRKEIVEIKNKEFQDYTERVAGKAWDASRRYSLFLRHGAAENAPPNKEEYLNKI